jgi:hypothetical protein
LLYPSWHATTLVIEPFRCQFTVATSNKRGNLFELYAEREPIWLPRLFKMDHFKLLVDVRFGSKADIAISPRDVRFSTKSGH